MSTSSASRHSRYDSEPMRFARLAAARMAYWTAFSMSSLLLRSGVGSHASPSPPSLPRPFIGTFTLTPNVSAAASMSSWRSGRKSGSASSINCLNAMYSISR